MNNQPIQSSMATINLDTPPIISIIVRTKDRSNLLKNALDSLVLQSYADLQVIIINDGGNDITALIQSYSHKLTIKTIINNKSVGRAQALNHGILAAEGEWLGILDDDDIYLPDAISKLINFSSNSNAKVVYGKVNMLDFQDSQNPKHIRYFDTAFNKERFIFDNFIPVNSLLIKREVLQTIGEVDTDFLIFEDWDFLYRISQITDFHYLDTMVAEYRSYGDATAIGGKTNELHSQFRTLFYHKHFQSFTPSMLSCFYNLVLQDNQKKYLSSIDQLLLLNHTFNDRNDHTLAYTKQVNDSLFARLDQIERRLNDAEVNIVQQIDLALKQNNVIIEQQSNLHNTFLEQTQNISQQTKAVYEQNGRLNTLRQEQISTIFDKNNEINTLRQQQFESLQCQLTDIKFQLNQTFFAKLHRLVKRIFTSKH